MKLLIILSLSISTLAFGAETKTECPWMREMNKRNNPKSSLASHNIKLNVDAKSLVNKQ